MTQWGIDTLFNPAKRHMDEEKRRLQSTRQQIGDNSGGKRIDLESGRVTIERADEPEAGTPTPTPAGEPAGKVAGKVAGKAAGKVAGSAAKKVTRGKGEGEPSAAAKRAAARRGRTLD